MNCNEARDLILTDALDAEISPADKRELLTHLVACESCRLLMDQAEERLKAAFLNAPRPAPPDHIWNRISAKLDEIEMAGRKEPSAAGPGLLMRLLHLFHGTGQRFAWGAAAVIAIAIISFSLHGPPKQMIGRLSPVTASLVTICEGDSEFEETLVSCTRFDTPIEKLFF